MQIPSFQLRASLSSVSLQAKCLHSQPSLTRLFSLISIHPYIREGVPGQAPSPFEGSSLGVFGASPRPLLSPLFGCRIHTFIHTFIHTKRAPPAPSLLTLLAFILRSPHIEADASSTPSSEAESEELASPLIFGLQSLQIASATPSRNSYTAIVSRHLFCLTAHA